MSAVQARWDRDRRAAVGWGFGILLAGLALVAAGVLAGPGLLAVLGWAVAGAGMGAAFNAATTDTLGQVPAERQGRVSAALQLAQTLATAVVSGLGGALIAHVGATATAFAAIFGFTAVLSLLGVATTRRLRTA